VSHTLHVIDIKRAQQHLFFNQYSQQLEKQKGQSQQLLFPRNIELPAAKLAILLELMDAFSFLGFDLGHFGGNAIIINGLPAQLPACNEQALIEQIIDDYEQTAGDIKLSKNQSLALSMSRQSASKQAIARNKEEFEYLLSELFKCNMPQYTFDGKQIYVTLGADSIFELFNKKKRL
jgi:DNA mismatch repair protein MutL